jgi:predicted histone-like DNA-binding protein
MAIIYKKTLRVNPINPNEPGKFYPQLITMGQRITKEKIIYEIKEKSSLSAGDIESVTTNFIETISRNLLAGFSVQIPKLGLFYLSAKTEGSDTEELCTSKKIKSIHVNFRPAKNLRPNLVATRAEDKIEFIDFTTYTKGLSFKGLDPTKPGADTVGEGANVEDETETGGGTNTGGNTETGGSGEDYLDPNA